MNVHSMLLVLVAGLFMTVWDCDGRRNGNLLTRATTAPHRRAARSHDAITVRRTSGSGVDRRHSRHRPVVQTMVPLPDEIAPGRYRAVNHSGQTQTVIVPTNAANSGTALPARDFYMKRDGLDRWYFIRVDAQLQRIADEQRGRSRNPAQRATRQIR